MLLPAQYYHSTIITKFNGYTVLASYFTSPYYIPIHHLLSQTSSPIECSTTYVNGNPVTTTDEWKCRSQSGTRNKDTMWKLW